MLFPEKAALRFRIADGTVISADNIPLRANTGDLQVAPNSEALLRNSTDSKETRFFTETNAVPDVCRGKLRWDRGILVFQENCSGMKTAECSRYNDILLVDDNGRCIAYPRSVVLVTESPHTDEFAYCDESNEWVYRPGKRSCYFHDIVPVAPLQGNSSGGNSISSRLYREVLRDHLTFLRQWDEIPVIICNPIQYQTSLWALHRRPLGTMRSLRDRIWRSIWSAGAVPGRQGVCREYFRDRVLNYYHPILVINACTRNNSEEITLQQCINEALYGLDVPIIEDDHPFRWAIKYRRDSV